MAVFILPDAQDDLLSLQEYMLDRWSEGDWLRAEDEIFEQLDRVNSGLLGGAAVRELAGVGITDYRVVLTSHHKLVYRRVGGDVYVYAVAGHKQDFLALWTKRMLKA